MIQNASRDSNVGNVCLFLAATCTSQCKWRSLRTNAGMSALIYTFRVSSLTFDCNGVFAIKTHVEMLEPNCLSRSVEKGERKKQHYHIACAVEDEEKVLPREGILLPLWIFHLHVVWLRSIRVIGWHIWIHKTLVILHTSKTNVIISYLWQSLKHMKLIKQSLLWYCVVPKISISMLLAYIYYWQ